MSPTYRLLVCASLVVLIAPPIRAGTEPSDGRRSAYEPEQAEMRRKKEEIERRAAEARADGERRSEEIRRKLAQERAKAAKRWAASNPNDPPTVQETTSPKVIDIEYDKANEDSQGDGNPPKVIEIKGQGEAVERPNAVQPPTVAARDAYRDEIHHYSMKLPPGWRAMTDGELSQCNNFARTAAVGLGVQYHGGFRPNRDQPGSPYILLQAKSGQIRSYDELERSLAKELPGAVKQVEGALKNFAKDISFGDAALDRSQNRIVLRMQMDVQGVGKLQAMSVGHIGSKELVFVHCYAKERDFANAFPIFEQITDSFEFDDGYEFADGNEPLDGGENDRWNRWLFGGIFGGAGGGVFGVILVLLRVTNRFILDPGPPQYRGGEPNA